MPGRRRLTATGGRLHADPERPRRARLVWSPPARRSRRRCGCAKATRTTPTFYDSLKLAPGQPVSLAEWRVHLWLDGLNRALKVGDKFPLTLTFEPGGSVELEIYVEEGPGH
ncbi:MAG: copper chaperone PCu(A)C [Rhodovibrio sp.]|nr:copper chaperone PCu(A)C [Rhodovibrio sp.]